MLEKSNISIPVNLHFIPINFNKDNLKDKLTSEGFDNGKKTLFLWEGVIYYLKKSDIDAALSFIKSYTQAGSTICFDISIQRPEMKDKQGYKDLRNSMKLHYSSEPIQFSIQEGQIDSYLTVMGFQIVEHYHSAELDNKYLKLKDGSLAGNVPERFNFILAKTIA
jgi:methyltransferase (TIGR00027 family)